MSSFWVNTQLTAIFSGYRKQLVGLSHAELVRGQVCGHISPLTFSVLQVGAVAAHTQGDTVTDFHGVNRASINFAQVIHQSFQARTVNIGLRISGHVAVIEATQPSHAFFFTQRNTVQVSLHGGGEVIIHHLREVFFQQTGDGESQPRGHQRLAPVIHIATIANYAHDRGIGGGAANFALFQGLNQ